MYITIYYTKIRCRFSSGFLFVYAYSVTLEYRKLFDYKKFSIKITKRRQSKNKNSYHYEEERE
nr:MAG TPA: hypothetical protein [Caudoviricetes sp.]